MNVMNANNLVEHIFRHEYGKIMALLVHKFGTTQIEIIEDAIQDALIKAMQVWSFKKIPDNPTGWLLRVSSNNLIDTIRRSKKITLHQDVNEFLEGINSKNENVLLGNEINDSRLKMIFACCHPSISQEYQIILSLKLISGFSNKEIAKALLKKEEAVAKSFTRAKKKLKVHIKNLEIPVELGLRSRVNIVLKIIYLLFSEGYKATTGEDLIKKDMCFEAIRLALLLTENKYCNQPEVNALIALMCFHASRFEARIDDNNEIVDLEHHDRMKYDRDLIIVGNQYLELATRQSEEPSSYHLQAAISYCYSIAESFSKIDWSTILEFYDLLLKKQRTPIVILNRLISFSKVYGTGKAMLELKLYEQSLNYTETTLYNAIKAEFFNDLRKYDESKLALKSVIENTQNPLEKKHFEKKLELLLYNEKARTIKSRH